MAKILNAAMQTIVEDLYGRVGYMDIGISHSGYMDHFTPRLLNKVLGNDLNEAGLEIVGGGFSIEFEEESVFAYGGAQLEATLNGEGVSSYTSIPVKKGDVLSFAKLSPVMKGFRVYLCFAGGMEADVYLGSKATATYGNFGGYGGRALKAGDELKLGLISDKNAAYIGKKVKEEYLPQLTDEWELRAMPGPDAAPDFVTEEGMEEIYSQTYKAQMFCDRAGIRLKGPAPKFSPQRVSAGGHPSNVTDHGYPGLGGVNVSGDTLIMFPVEAPTCGGLMCVVSVIYADLWKMGQIFPGRDKIKFVYSTQEEAIELRKKQNEIFEDDRCIS